MRTKRAKSVRKSLIISLVCKRDVIDSRFNEV